MTARVEKHSDGTWRVVRDDDRCNWSGNSAQRRHELLCQVEAAQLEKLQSSTAYSWAPWEAVVAACKELRSKEHVYYVIYHELPAELRDRVLEYFRMLGVESQYGTDRADADLKRIEEAIRAALKVMPKAAPAGNR